MRPTRLDPANFRGLVLGCIEAKFVRKYAFESPRRDLLNALLCTALQSQFFVKKIAELFAAFLQNVGKISNF